MIQRIKMAAVDDNNVSMQSTETAVPNASGLTQILPNSCKVQIILKKKRLEKKGETEKKKGRYVVRNETSALPQNDSG